MPNQSPSLPRPSCPQVPLETDSGRCGRKQRGPSIVRAALGQSSEKGERACLGCSAGWNRLRRGRGRGREVSPESLGLRGRLQPWLAAVCLQPLLSHTRHCVPSSSVSALPCGRRGKLSLRGGLVELLALSQHRDRWDPCWDVGGDPSPALTSSTFTAAPVPGCGAWQCQRAASAVAGTPPAAGSPSGEPGSPQGCKEAGAPPGSGRFSPVPTSCQRPTCPLRDKRPPRLPARGSQLSCAPLTAAPDVLGQTAPCTPPLGSCPLLPGPSSLQVTGGCPGPIQLSDMECWAYTALWQSLNKTSF